MSLTNPEEVLKKLLNCTLVDGASDLHISANVAPFVRVNGYLKKVGDFILSPQDIHAMIMLTLNDKQKAIYNEKHEIDYAHAFNKTCRFRVNAFKTIYGPAAAFRKIPLHIPEMHEINAPMILTELASRNRGIVIITGPTGAGKSTTLAAMVEYINQNFHKHIITIEDPVEYVYHSNKSLINQRQIGSSTNSFPSALRNALREDPDVLLVGEMRDAETIRLALTAAETGHLVLSTMHTNSSYESINRIVDVFPENDKKLAVSLLSGSLLAIIAQRLLLTKDGNGLTPAHEILIANAAIKNLIREGQIPQIYSMMQVGSKQGMVTMKDSVHSLLERNLIDQHTAEEILVDFQSEKKHDRQQY